MRFITFRYPRATIMVVAAALLSVVIPSLLRDDPSSAAHISTAPADVVGPASAPSIEIALANVNILTTYVEAVQRSEVVQYIVGRIAEDQAVAAEAQQEAEAAKMQAIVAYATPAPVSAPVVATSNHASSDLGGFFACVRQRESGGDYSINTGNGYYGAYQFLQSTWNSIAASSGRSDLVGVLPSNASPADQDAMAMALYAQQGAAPWGGGCP